MDISETTMKKVEASFPGFYSWMPPEELKCVWMTAGVLTYKLCNRGFDCERCLLHQALSADDPAAVKSGLVH